jgi:hypothetical protein
MSALAFTFDTEPAPSRMGGATGAAPARPSLLDRLIDERRRGDCTDRRRPAPADDHPTGPPVADEPAAAAPAPAAPSPRAPLVTAPATPVTGAPTAAAAPAPAVSPPVGGPAAAVAAPAAAAPTAPSPRAPLAGGARSLDELVSGAWDSLTTTETAACFVCGGDLLPRFGAGARPVGGRCRDCGSELS